MSYMSFPARPPKRIPANPWSPTTLTACSRWDFTASQWSIHHAYHRQFPDKSKKQTKKKQFCTTTRFPCYCDNSTAQTLLPSQLCILMAWVILLCINQWWCRHNLSKAFQVSQILQRPISCTWANVWKFLKFSWKKYIYYNVCEPKLNPSSADIIIWGILSWNNSASDRSDRPL